LLTNQLPAEFRKHLIIMCKTSRSGCVNQKLPGLFLVFLLFSMSTLCQTTNWTGAVSALWSNPANWTNGVPQANSEAYVPWLPASAHQPIINVNTVFRKLTMNSNPNTVLVADGIQVTITGTISIGYSATFNVGNGAVTINGYVSTGGNLRLNNGTLTFVNGFSHNSGSAFNIDGTGTLNIGTSSNPVDFDLGGGNYFNLNNGNMNVYGDFSMNGGSTFNVSGGILNIMGTTAITGNSDLYAGDGTIKFNGNVSMNGGGTLNAESSELIINCNTWNTSGGGTFNPGTSTAVFSTDTQITGNDVTFYNMELEGDATVTSNVNMLILNTLMVDGELIVIPGKTLDVVGEISGSGSTSSNRPFIITILINSLNSITVVFNQPLDPVTAQTASNYRVQDSLGNLINNPTNPVLGGGNREVTLTLGFSIQENVKYYLRVNNVKNTSNQAVSPNHLKMFGIFGDPNRWVWTGNTDTDWNKPANWNKSSIPSATAQVLIPQRPNKPLINNLQVTVLSIEIQPNSSLTIGSTGKLSVTGSVNNQPGVTGLIIESSSAGTGSFICNQAGLSATVKRYIPGAAESWHMLSSPMESQTISPAFTPSGTYGDGTGYALYYWHEPDTSWIYFNHPASWAATHGSANFIPGRGYMVAYQQPNPTLVFSGQLNHGNVSLPVTRSPGMGDPFGANIMGNPFPSSIDWKAATGWTRNTLDTRAGAYCFWIWNETALNYGVYSSGAISDVGTLGVTRYIPPMQGFFVSASQTGTVSLDNSVRVHNGAGNWLKQGEELISKVKFSVAEISGNSSDEISIEFGHTDIDGARKLFSFVEGAPALSLPYDDDQYSLRLLNQIDHDPVIPVCFRAGKSGNYLLKATFEPSLFEMLELEDLFTGKFHDFKQNAIYDFTARQADDSRRFVLHLKNGNYPNPHDDIPANVYVIQSKLFVDLTLLGADRDYQLTLFDLNGRAVFTQTIKGGDVYSFEPNLVSNIYIARITGQEGVKTVKLFF